MLQLHRTGGMRPRDHERLVVDEDGTFRLWRTVGSATQPPTPVGDFRGELEPAALREVVDAVAAAAESAPSTGGSGSAPGTSFDRLDIAGTRSEVPADGEVTGSWAAAFAVARRLLVDLTQHPYAALELLLVDGQGLRLSHLGTQPLGLDLSELVVRAARLENGAAVEHWEQPAPGPFSVTAEPGWTHDLPFPSWPSTGVVGSAEGFLLNDEGSWVVARVTTR